MIIIHDFLANAESIRDDGKQVTIILDNGVSIVIKKGTYKSRKKKKEAKRERTKSTPKTRRRNRATED